MMRQINCVRPKPLDITYEMTKNANLGQSHEMTTILALPATNSELAELGGSSFTVSGETQPLWPALQVGYAPFGAGRHVTRLANCPLQ
jgi:hypothetical protein